MGRHVRVPSQLRSRPFTLEEARRAGLDRWHLEGKSWRRLGPEVYAWTGLGESPLLHLAAALLRLPPTAVFSGLSAAWLHGLDVEPCAPIEVTLPIGAGVSGRSAIRISRASLEKRDVALVRKLRATSMDRTLADLSARMTISEAVVLTDAAAHMGLTNLERLDETAARAAGRPGVAAFRRVIHHTEPAAESPMESRLRMLLVLAGLPRPVAQHPIHDRQGRFLGRPDLYFPERRLGLEYDGGVHRTSLVDDNRRQNRLLAEGIRLLRFTAGDIYSRPESVIDQVRLMLASSPKPAAADTRASLNQHHDRRCRQRRVS